HVLGLIRLGILDRYRGCQFDTLITYFHILPDSFPRLVLILLVIAAFKADIYYVMVVVGITGMPVIANLIAGKIAFLRQKSFIEAADRKSTRLNSSHGSISYAVFCLKKKTKRT